MTETDCLFCKIIAGDMPGEKLYEDDHTFVVLDIRPTNPGHCLVIPKKHSRNIFDIEPETLSAIMPVVQKMSHAVSKAVSADGVNIHINNEPAAGQVIFHTHVHVIPRFENDGYKLWGGKEYKDNEGEKIADTIRATLAEVA